MWLPRVDFRTSHGIKEDLWGETTISPARAGSNILEYGRLTELSNNLEYFANVCLLGGGVIVGYKGLVETY
jgi:hypothetical protein